MIWIFDLDGTVIDTSHRYRNNEHGHCDLDFWFANSTPEMIAKDTLLPLADEWRKYKARGDTVIVCTARDFSPLNGVDLGAIYTQFLTDNALHSDAILHRCMAGDDHETLGDGALKIRLLDDWGRSQGFADDWYRGALMFDDNPGVISTLYKERRLYCFDAIKYNEMLRGGAAYFERKVA